MAGPQSFGKKENEKKKQAKRLEKQKRREERQASGAGGGGSMIAWVDEYGNIVDTPPVQAREEVRLEDVAIATPKKEAVEVEPLRGRVDYFNGSKGYGFIKELGTGEKYFFHISTAPTGITEGNIVTFEAERGARGMNAVGIVMAHRRDFEDSTKQ